MGSGRRIRKKWMGQDKFKEKVEFIMGQYEKEKFNFEEFLFEALEFIICRYYGYLVRVKREG